jgi:hypothetical protein
MPGLMAGCQATRSLDDLPVAVAWGLAGDEEAHGAGASIDGLVRPSRGDLQALAGAEDKLFAFDFEDKFAFEHTEELARVTMQMALLLSS